MITIPFKYTKDDISKAFDLHYLKKFPVRSKLMLITGLALLFFSIFLFFIKNEAIGNLKWMLLVLSIIYLGFYSFRKKSLVKIAMRNKTIVDIKEITFNNVEITFKGEKGYSTQQWGEFEDIAQDDYTTLFYLSKYNFFIVPMRILDAEQRKQFMHYTSPLREKKLI